MLITQIEINPVSLPLRNTFRTHLGQKKITKNVMIEIVCANGARGVGEASASLAMPEATQEKICATLVRAKKLLLNQPILQWEKLARALAHTFPKHPTAISAAQCAMLDAYCQSKKISMMRYFGNKNKTVETFYTIPALGIKECKTIVRSMTRKGFKKFKIKVDGGQGDLFRVQTVHAQCPAADLIVDANQAWSVRQALHWITQYQTLNLPVRLIEQPVQKNNFKGMQTVAKNSAIPIAADESFRTLEDAKRLVDLNAAEVFNIKLAKIGLMQSLDAAKFLKQSGKKLMIGCMMESAIGLKPSVHWACGSGLFDWVDLDSFLLLKNQAPQQSFIADQSKLKVR